MSTAGDPDNNWNKEKEDPQEVRWIEAEWLQDKADQDNNDKGGNGGADDDDNGDDPDESPDFADLFADPDPLETFNFSWTIADRVPEDGNNTNINTSTNTNSRTVDIALTGHKAELGQTLHSTGLTLWRASELLCDYMLRHPAALQGQRVLEVCVGHVDVPCICMCMIICMSMTIMHCLCYSRFRSSPTVGRWLGSLWHFGSPLATRQGRAHGR